MEKKCLRILIRYMRRFFYAGVYQHAEEVQKVADNPERDLLGSLGCSTAVIMLALLSSSWSVAYLLKMMS